MVLSSLRGRTCNVCTSSRLPSLESHFNNKCGNIWHGTWTWQLDECRRGTLTGLKWSIKSTCVGVCGSCLEQEDMKAVGSPGGPQEQDEQEMMELNYYMTGQDKRPILHGIKIIHLFIVANLLSDGCTSWFLFVPQDMVVQVNVVVVAHCLSLSPSSSGT